ncbi:MAG: RNB domain-containing ribonuclease, partial [Candidatus Cloacimonetes bacterium]|nr:RNB domain-containing ribonuclease [Candidatus Cloacimonadota bacterium]
YGGTGNESYPSQAYLSTLPEFHPGIGSAAYLHATSPIRRYTDLVNHYQILALLEGKAAPFSEDDLQLKIGIIEKKLFMLKELSHRSNRFWCLKYIAAKYLYEPLDVCYRGALRDLIRLEIIPWGFQILAKCDHHPQGEFFKVAVHAIDWEKGIVMADIL